MGSNIVYFQLDDNLLMTKSKVNGTFFPGSFNGTVFSPPLNGTFFPPPFNGTFFPPPFNVDRIPQNSDIAESVLPRQESDQLYLVSASHSMSAD